MAQGPMSSILVTIRITIRIQESEVRNPHSLDYRKSYQRILMKFYGELWCGPETNCLHFGYDPHYYPDAGGGVRSGSRSGSGKNCHNSIMLEFGGGLCSLSTYYCCCCVHIARTYINLFAALMADSKKFQ